MSICAHAGETTGSGVAIPERGEHREHVAEANHAIAIDVRRAAAPIGEDRQDVGEPDHLVAIHVLGAVVGLTAIAVEVANTGGVLEFTL
ncbi:MAG: hypothetical protein VYA02_02490, partial [Planctomycetota bacterium]|nr:hypothetical protein [Planctomycetota bacterium]